MKSFLSAFGVSLLLLLAGCNSPTSSQSESDAEAAAGRALLTRYADAIVKIELVATTKISTNGRSLPPRESKLEVNGTVISSAGLTVTSLSAIDPSVMLEEMRSSFRGAAAHMEIGETEYKEVKLSLGDGTSVPAKVVLKDADLDLAFIAPEAGASAASRKFAWVNLSNAAKPEVLGTFYYVSRAPKQLQRVPLVDFVTLSGSVQKPRQLFLPSGESVGCPMFDGQGRVVGICLRHLTGDTASLRSFVILPAADVAEETKQTTTVATQTEKSSDAPPAAKEKSDASAQTKTP